MPHLAELVANAKAAVEDAQDVAALDLVRVEYLGKKAILPCRCSRCVNCRRKSVRPQGR